MKTFSIITLGCKVNQAESEKIIRQFQKNGFGPAGSLQTADVIVINTCTVTHQADHKSRQAIRRARRNQSALVVATGCGVETGELFVNPVKDIDLTITNADKEKLVRLVKDKINIETETATAVVSAKQHLHTRALVKVQDGCDRFCSYCIVPLVRGKPVSRPAREIIDEIKTLVSAGVKEVVLTGINLGKYGTDVDAEARLTGLLEDILDIKELSRLRLSSIEISDITPGFVSLFGRQQRVCRHLHVPLQSGSDRILKAMNRSYTAEEYLERTSRLKQVAPDIALTTDVMVGFPGETSEDFKATGRVIKKTSFRKLHVFKFSSRPGTPAAEMADQVPEEVKDKRSKELIKLGDDLARDYARRFVGRELAVLVEKRLKDGLLTGMADNYLRICFTGPSGSIGELVTVQAVKSENGCLWGELAG